MIPARRRWGQHFLVRPEIAGRIVEAARLRPEETALEIGPGDGALTRPLLARARRVLAIEIDRARAAALPARLDGPGPERLAVLSGDALERSYGQWLAAVGWEPPAVLVANLPYNVGTPLLGRALEEPEAISRAVATVQREVAVRFAARPGEEGYGFLSVRTAAFGTARRLFDVPPGAFRPRPKVVSSVLALDPRPSPVAASLRDRALTLASLGFQARRKTLANALSREGGRDRWERALARIGRDPRTRAEELAWEDFLALACAEGTP